MNKKALSARIRHIAQEHDLTVRQCWLKLYLERFLTRLSRSSHSDKFIFKGGFLLSYLLDIGRETSDLDFLLTRMRTQTDDIVKAVHEVISISFQDGFSFSYVGIEELTQPHMEYPGYRITLQITFEGLRENIKIDVGVGDIVDPESREIPLSQYKGKPLFEGEISLLVYPVETIFAEKLETVLSKGAANSRMKDYHDLLIIAREPNLLDRAGLKKSCFRTFKNRGTQLCLIQFSEADLSLLEKYWSLHVNKLGDIAKGLNLPKGLLDLIQEMNACLVKLKLITLGNFVAEMKGKALLEQVKTALALGADVNDDSRNKHRPFQMAIKKGYTDVAMLLLEHGADLYHRDQGGLTPLELAINSRQFEIAQQLIKKGVPLNALNNMRYDYAKLYEFQQSRLSQGA